MRPGEIAKGGWLQGELKADAAARLTCTWLCNCWRSALMRSAERITLRSCVHSASSCHACLRMHGFVCMSRFLVASEAPGVVLIYKRMNMKGKVSARRPTCWPFVLVHSNCVALGRQ